jgi:probable F420-dependent oxidoreductase
MRVGCVFPQYEIGNDPAMIRRFVQGAESLGCTHLRVYDHVLGAVHENRMPPLTGAYTDQTPFHEPFVLFGYLAGVTTTIELVAGVIVLPQRQTALVAKQAAEVDILSGGRLRLGVGVGWNHVEYEALGMDFDDRGRREEEQIEVLRLLLSSPLVDYTGRWHRIDRASILPRPDREVPIWLGGFSDVAYRRAARLADGFLFARPAAKATAALPALRRYVEEAGRDWAAFGFDALVELSAGPDRWAADAEEFRSLGATHLTVSTMGAGLVADQHLGALEQYLSATSEALR